MEVLEGLGKDQEKAVKSALMWYNVNFKQPIFTIAGGPGTGKTFIVDKIIKVLGLKPHQVSYATYTGKASLVLWEKGIPATTIHQLIYNTYIEKNVKIVDGKEVVEKEVKVALKDNLNPLTRLIVIDEISMVSEHILKDLLSFGVKIICLGDLDQLPPVKGKNNGILDNPDVILTENFRQGDDNNILKIANNVINGKDLQYGNYGNVLIAPYNMMSAKALNSVDQVICNTNKLRHQLNYLIREYKGFNISKKINNGEKIIATQNDWIKTEFSPRINDNLPIVNGMIGKCQNLKNVDGTPISEDNPLKRKLIIDFVPDFDTDVFYKEINIDIEDFGDRSNKKKFLEGTIEMDYGYAITVHKSQGSEFKSVALVIDDNFRMGGERYFNQLLYTGITRASEKLIIFI